MTRCLLGAVLVCTLVGCRFDPEVDTRHQSPRDDETYEDVSRASDAARPKRRLLITSDVMAHRRRPNHEAAQIEYMRTAVLNASMDAFSQMERFQAVSGSADLSVSSRSLETNGVPRKEVPGDIDLTLKCESSMEFLAKYIGTTSHSKKSRGTEIETRFRMVDNLTESIPISETYTSQAKCSKGEIATAIRQAAEANVRKFARLVASRYLQPGRVTETRDGGRYAKISIGDDRMLDVETDLFTASRVDFLEMVPPPNGRGKPSRRVIAHGTVVKVEKQSAWVEIDMDWISKTSPLSASPVKKGHYVNVSEEGNQEKKSCLAMRMMKWLFN